jgi:hypothetical protein
MGIVGRSRKEEAMKILNSVGTCQVGNETRARGLRSASNCTLKAERASDRRWEEGLIPGWKGEIG